MKDKTNRILDILRGFLDGYEFAVLPREGYALAVFLYPYTPFEDSRTSVTLDAYYLASNKAHRLCKQIATALVAAGIGATHRYRDFVKPLAIQAGLACGGFANTLTYHAAFGSYFHIGAVTIEGECESFISVPPRFRVACTGCMRCADACPSGAIGKRGYDRTACLRHKMDLPNITSDVDFVRQIGTCAFGCDICQRVCPINGHVPRSNCPDYLTDAIKQFGEGFSEPLSELIGRNLVNSALLELIRAAETNLPKNQR